MAFLLTSIPIAFTFRTEIVELCCEIGPGEFEINFANKTTEVAQIPIAAQFYVTPPGTPEFDARVTSGLLRLSERTEPLKIQPNKEVSVRATVRNVKKIIPYIQEGDNFIQVIFSVSPNPVRGKFLLDKELFLTGLTFEVSPPNSPDVGANPPEAQNPESSQSVYNGDNPSDIQKEIEAVTAPKFSISRLLSLSNFGADQAYQLAEISSALNVVNKGQTNVILDAILIENSGVASQIFSLRAVDQWSFLIRIVQLLPVIIWFRSPLRSSTASVLWSNCQTR